MKPYEEMSDKELIALHKSEVEYMRTIPDRDGDADCYCIIHIWPIQTELENRGYTYKEGEWYLYEIH